jgi:lysine 6-dehydrogenase
MFEMKIVVFGGGLQGRVIAQNLVNRKETPQIEIADIQEPAALPKGVTYRRLDVLDERQVGEAATGADASVLAVPSAIARQSLSNLIAAGIPVADVCFTPDPPLDLDKQAKGSGACCVVDCGVAPGLSHILVGSAFKKFGSLDSIQILVGGMPINPPEVFHHAVYFNPRDLIAEYVRPARARENGKNTNEAPLSAEVFKVTDKAGAFDAFLSDGLRSLLTSFPSVPNMWERTLRWPGHMETMQSLHALGLFDEGIAGDTTADTIGKKFAGANHPDFLVLRIECQKGDQKLSWRMYDKVTDGESAMSRTTGYTTAAVAMLLAQKRFVEPGVHAPEKLGEDESLVDAVVKDLAERGVKVEELTAARR